MPTSADSSVAYDLLVYIGRFQPFHNGHLHILQRALAEASQVVLVVGSSFKPRTAKNPFSAAEREAMIRATLDAIDPALSSRVHVIPVRDYYDDDKWSRAVTAAVTALAPAGARIGVIGHTKDESSYYLSLFSHWASLEVLNCEGINASDLRQLYFDTDNPAGSLCLLQTRLPAPVFAVLRAFQALPAYRLLCQEHASLQRDRQAWAGSPYPPQFITVDAVVTCDQHLLMVRRGGDLGHGQWALPGGFVEPNERILTAVLRELVEETAMHFNAAYFKTRLRDRDVFDHPGRSQRGRTVTHAFHFDLSMSDLPAVIGSDDAQEARWLPVSSLAAMECEIFEDHLAIIDRFLHVL